MTRREVLQQRLTSKLSQELGTVVVQTAEYTQTLDLILDVEGKRMRAIVTVFPEGENPETYGGAPRWDVTLLDAEGAVLDRRRNPEEALELALQMIDWKSVRRDLLGRD